MTLSPDGTALVIDSMIIRTKIDAAEVLRNIVDMANSIWPKDFPIRIDSNPPKKVGDTK